MSWKQILKSTTAVVLAVLCTPAIAFASQTSSSHYQINEVFFGSGGELNSCSTNYCSKQSAGETAVGKTCSSGTLCAQAGFNTDRYPYIEMTVSNTSIDLGTATATTTKTATASFSVKAYLAEGYDVVTASPPPTNSGYTIHTDSTPQVSSVGTEQFGINLVANTSPATFGANPVYVPDSTFSFGQVDANYSTPNQYKYQQGDRVAFSQASSSFTTYTVAYIFNVSNVTPGGLYTMQHVLVTTATY